MADLYGLSKDDVEILKELVRQYKAGLKNPHGRAPQEHHDQDHQAPEVYIAYPQDDPNADDQAGTGTGTYWVRQPSLEIPGVIPSTTEEDFDVVGSEKCDLYKIVDAGDQFELRPVCGRDNKEECFHRAYNVGRTSVVDQYVLAIRDKYGNFIAINTGGLVKCMLAEDHPGRHTPGATAYKFQVWPGTWCPEDKEWRFPIDDGDAERTATDSFYGGDGFPYPTKYSQCWAQPMPDGDGNTVYSVVTGDCESAEDQEDWTLPCTGA